VTKLHNEMILLNDCKSSMFQGKIQRGSNRCEADRGAKRQEQEENRKRTQKAEGEADAAEMILEAQC
jgi:hypothetical protein